MSYDREGATPGPWRAGDTGGTRKSIITENGRYVIAHMNDAFAFPGRMQERDANAHHIVHCVNHYDELVEMLENTLAWLDEMCVQHCGGPAHADEARALLAKVNA